MMKKIIALLTALLMVLSLTACLGTNNNADATADEASSDVSGYTKDFDGLVKYVADNNANGTEAEIFYDILGADNGVRYVLNNNAYVEIYDFSKADNDTAAAILADIKDDGKFRPVPDGTEMDGVVTDSGKYVIAWDSSRSYKYEDKVATDSVKANW